MVAARDLNAGIEIGAGIHTVDELLELIPGVKVERIDIRVAAGDEAGEDLQHIVLGRGVVVQNRVRFEVTFLFVVCEAREHGPVVHVMSVKNRVVAREVGFADGIHEDAAACVFGSVQRVMEIVIIVSALQDRITDDGVRAVDPADDLGVLRQQRIEVNGNRTGDQSGRLFHDFSGRGGSGLQRRFCGRLCGRLCADKLLIQIIIFLGSGMIAVEGIVKLVPGEDKHAEEHTAQDDEKTAPEGT